MGIKGAKKPVTRLIGDPCQLTPRQLARFVAAHTEGRIKAPQVQILMDAIAEACLSALAQGYVVSWRGFISLDVRVLKPQKRWDNFNGKWWDCPESYKVHATVPADTTQKVVDLANVFLGETETVHPIRNRMLRLEDSLKPNRHEFE